MRRFAGGGQADSTAAPPIRLPLNKQRWQPSAQHPQMGDVNSLGIVRAAPLAARRCGSGETRELCEQCKMAGCRAECGRCAGYATGVEYDILSHLHVAGPPSHPLPACKWSQHAVLTQQANAGRSGACLLLPARHSSRPGEETEDTSLLRTPSPLNPDFLLTMEMRRLCSAGHNSTKHWSPPLPLKLVPLTKHTHPHPTSQPTQFMAQDQALPIDMAPPSSPPMPPDSPPLMDAANDSDDTSAASEHDDGLTVGGAGRREGGAGALVPCLLCAAHTQTPSASPAMPD